MTDTRKFEKMPMLTDRGTGICCIWQAVYKKDAALQTRQRGFANVSRQPISTGEREAYFLDPLHLWLLWWDKTSYWSPLSMETLCPSFGVVLSLLSPHYMWTGRLHELIWAPAAGGMQWLEQREGAHHGCIVMFLQLCYHGWAIKSFAGFEILLC